jgi:hypothetical protein
MSIEKSNYLIGNRTHDVPACSIMPQPTTLKLDEAASADSCAVKSCHSGICQEIPSDFQEKLLNFQGYVIH